MQTTDDRPTPHVHDCYQPDRIQRLMTETASISIHAVIISGQPRTYDQNVAMPIGWWVRDSPHRAHNLHHSQYCRPAGSKATAMDPEIASNQDYDDHYTNDGKDVHFFNSHLMVAMRGVLAARNPAAIGVIRA
jgi:hypothetical protein